MSITHNSNIVVNLSPGGVSGWPNGMGIHRLRFSVQYQTPPRKETFIARNFRATVAVSCSHQNGAHLGIAWPEGAWIVRTGQFSNSAAILFDLDLRSEQLALIENLRAGGDLVLRQQRRSSSELGKNSTPGTMMAVVQQCRRAIESVQKALDLKQEINTAIAAFTESERRKMTKRARALLVSEIVLHYAHPAHHVDDKGEIFDYGRRDATFMLALASAVVANSVRAKADNEIHPRTT